MSANQKLPKQLTELLENRNIRHGKLGDERLYAVVDLIAAVIEKPGAAELWEDLKRWEPQLKSGCREISVQSPNEAWEIVEMVPESAVFRIIMALPGPKAEWLKGWIANSAARRLEEAADPELALCRTRALYEQKAIPGLGSKSGSAVSSLGTS